MSRTQIVVLLALGSMIALIVISGLAAHRRAGVVFMRMSELHESNQRVERILADLRSDIHLSGIWVRDFLLDPTHIGADYYRQQLRRLRADQEARLKDLARLLGAAEASDLRELSTELAGYWESMEPLFDWTPQQKVAFSHSFLRNQILPRRQAILEMADHTDDLNQAHWRRQREALDQSQTQFRKSILVTLGVVLTLGVLVAAVSVIQLARLERRGDRHRRRIEQTEQELRRLSQQLVKAQEEERKRISRELHDEVGQKLTALRVDLSRLGRLRSSPDGVFDKRLEEVRRLTEETMKVVRDLAMGLRPSMLDDLGLGPALEWLARDFSRRAVPVTLAVEGPFDGLPESHSTCVYRVVQEALTNCARHSRASQIRVAIHRHGTRASLVIQDDGVGFDPSGADTGLGLIGLQERVRELGGSMTIASQPGKGTALSVEIPVPESVA